MESSETRHVSFVRPANGLAVSGQMMDVFVESLIVESLIVESVIINWCLITAFSIVLHGMIRTQDINLWISGMTTHCSSQFCPMLDTVNVICWTLSLYSLV